MRWNTHPSIGAEAAKKMDELVMPIEVGLKQPDVIRWLSLQTIANGCKRLQIFPALEQPESIQTPIYMPY